MRMKRAMTPAPIEQPSHKLDKELAESLPQNDT